MLKLFQGSRALKRWNYSYLHLSIATQVDSYSIKMTGYIPQAFNIRSHVPARSTINLGGRNKRDPHSETLQIRTADVSPQTKSLESGRDNASAHLRIATYQDGGSTCTVDSRHGYVFSLLAVTS
jgi:hypothetical protein